MKRGYTQVAIDQQDPTVGLFRDDPRQVRGYEGFPLMRQWARNDELLHLSPFAHEIELRP
jgi:hypothetical protein